MIFNGLRSRILLFVGCAVLLTTASIAFFAQREMEATIVKSEDRHAQYLLRMALLNVENEYESLLFHKKTTLKRRKQGLKNIVDITIANITETYNNFLRGKFSETEAKRLAIQATRSYRYDNGVGYLWINDLGTPYPRFIMHPTLPELEGKNLDDPRFFTALGMHKHILSAMVEIAQATGSGYIDYLWPKPVAGKLTADQPKISYVKLFKEWGWIIGTGVYVDDIEKEVNERQKAIISELNKTFAKISIADSGYIFIFNGARRMLVHPNITGQDFSEMKDPSTGKFIVDELIEASKTPAKPFNYLWDKPDQRRDFRFKKRAYVTHFKPLDWYIVSSVYTNEIAQPALKLRARIIYLSLFSLFFGLIVSLVLARNLVKPLQKLSQAAKEIETRGVSAEIKIPVSGATETRQLGTVLENMVQSIRQAIDEKEKALFAVADSYQDLAYTNTRLETEITERKHAEQALKQARDGLETRVAERTAELARANQAKSEFLANISHEIRTPLNAITGYTRLLSIEVSDPNQKNYLNAIKASGNTLLVLLNDILDLSKIEAGMMPIYTDPMDTSHLFNEILQIFCLKTNDGRRHFSIEIDDALPVALLLDETRLRQILLNLVGNAVKFTEEGFIKLTAKQLHVDHTQNRIDLSICVEDSGLGIRPEDRELIFDSFQQLEGRDRSKYGGTGLGLAICKRLIEMMNGSISVTGALGVGSKFEIILKNVAFIPARKESSANSIKTKAQMNIEPAIQLMPPEREGEPEATTAASSGFNQQTEIQKPDELLRAVKTRVMPAFEDLKGAIVIKKLQHFEQFIAELGEKHAVPALSEFSRELSAYRQNIDIVGINRVLNDFTGLLEQLMTAIEENHAETTPDLDR